MFDENKYTESDILMRSILSDAREDVPEHVWEGISSGLDKIEAARTRRPMVIWFRRSAIAVAAAAAVSVGVFFNWDRSSDIMPESSGKHLISVVEPRVIETDGQLASPDKLTALTARYIADAGNEVNEAKEVNEANEVNEVSEAIAVTEDFKKNVETPSVQEEAFFDDFIFEEETEVRSRTRTSIVLSGIAGTNNAPASGSGPMRRPTLSTSKPETGVEQKSSESTYGLPVSFGAGVKIDFSSKWALGIGANYTILTRKFFGTYTQVNSTGGIDESVSSDIRNVQQYIGIPVNMFYNILEKDYMNFYVYAGGTVEKCISDKYDILKTEYIYKGNVKGVQLSANMGLGIEFLLGRHLGLYVDPSLRYYFDCNQPKSIRTAQPFMMGLEMGLRVKL